jgi:hypothetical protein
MDFRLYETDEQISFRIPTTFSMLLILFAFGMSSEFLPKQRRSPTIADIHYQLGHERLQRRSTRLRTQVFLSAMLLAS